MKPTDANTYDVSRFPIGRVVTTPGVMAALKENYALINRLLLRHITGDWGDLDEEDRRSNEEALKTDTRILSAYQVNGIRIWVITEADRSSTTLLLPEEY